ncbi:MAG: DUF1205 domain-containing protein [Catenulispora sp.]|nr:DUF1205 domain-containing protein [Catenulispora sp.]
MRVLLAVPSRPGNLHNVVPLGWALRTGGHQVLVTARPAFTEAVNRTGLVAAEVGDPAGSPDWLADPAAVTDLLALIGRWRPDLVLWDLRAPAGAVAADVAGVVAVGVTGPCDAALATSDRISQLTAALGADGADRSASDVLGRVATILDTTPGSLAGPRVGTRMPMRMVPYTGPAVVPAWLRREPRRQRICVVLSGAAAPVAEIFEALGTVDAETVAVVALDAIPPGTTVPGDVRLVDAVPLDAVVSTCAAVLHDDDPGAFAAAAVAGVPQLSVTAADPAPWKDRVGSLLSDPAARSAAERLREEIVAAPSPVETVARLVELVADRSRIVGHRPGD